MVLDLAGEANPQIRGHKCIYDANAQGGGGCYVCAHGWEPKQNGKVPARAPQIKYMCDTCTTNKYMCRECFLDHPVHVVLQREELRLALANMRREFGQN